jgi:hypothetical protein
MGSQLASTVERFRNGFSASEEEGSAFYSVCTLSALLEEAACELHS